VTFVLIGALVLATAVVAEESVMQSVEDDAIEVVDEALEEAGLRDDDEVYRVLSENFNKLSDAAKSNALKRMLDDYFKTDVYKKMQNAMNPAFDAVHKATSDNYNGDLSTLKKLKGELNKFTARDGESARFLTNLYRMLMPKKK